MITYRYINKNHQPSSASYTLLIEDEDSDAFQDVIRIEKSFKVDIRQIDEEFLRIEARIEVERIKYELETAPIVPPIGPTTELPEESLEE
jgi:hypothetical protein